MADTPRLAIIVPVLNEIATLPALLTHLEHWQARGAEVLLVDGGSQDRTAACARERGFQVLDAPRGRARQMNAGARASRAANLLFLHADTRLPRGADRRVLAALSGADQAWGRFDVQIEGRSRVLPAGGLVDEPALPVDRHRHRRPGPVPDPQPV